MTYNVHGCVGLDGRRSEERIAAVIASFQPDIVGLQELDLGRKRSGGVDQAGVIAGLLGFDRLFHPAMRCADEHYGDAILSRWPLTRRRMAGLPSQKAFLFRENRAALWVEIQTPQGMVQVINTHFGVGAGERTDQAQALAGPEWAGAVPAGEPLIVMGDFNSLPGSRAWRILTETLRDASRVGGRRNLPTFPTFSPFLTLDYFFVNAACEVRGVSVGVGAGARQASDHFPLIGFFVLHCHANERLPRRDMLV